MSRLKQSIDARLFVETIRQVCTTTVWVRLPAEAIALLHPSRSVTVAPQVDEIGRNDAHFIVITNGERGVEVGIVSSGVQMTWAVHQSSQSWDEVLSGAKRFVRFRIVAGDHNSLFEINIHQNLRMQSFLFVLASSR